MWVLHYLNQKQDNLVTLLNLQAYSIYNMHVCDWEKIIPNNMGNFLLHLCSQWIGMMGRLFNTNLYIVLKNNTVKINLLVLFSASSYSWNSVIRVGFFTFARWGIFYHCRQIKMITNSSEDAVTQFLDHHLVMRAFPAPGLPCCQRLLHLSESSRGTLLLYLICLTSSSSVFDWTVEENGFVLLLQTVTSGLCRATNLFHCPWFRGCCFGQRDGQSSGGRCVWTTSIS